jgi:hypothetical protein
VLEAQTGSVSLLQRRFAIGYTRASKLIEAMGQANILGPHVGTQARQVLVSGEEWQAMKEQIAADKANGGKGHIGSPDETTVGGAAVGAAADGDDPFEEAFVDDDGNDR